MASPDAPLGLHPDRLLPAEPGVRALARELYDAVAALPIISPHGHVDPRILLDDIPFRDPASLFVTPDHYVTRLLHASGVSLDALGVGRGPLPESEARQVWRSCASHWHVFRGTPMRFWLEAELGDIFDVAVRPSQKTPDEIYDQIADRLTRPSTGPARCSSGSGSRSWPRRTIPATTCRPTLRLRKTTAGPAGFFHLPPGPLPGGCSARLGRASRSAGRGR